MRTCSAAARILATVAEVSWEARSVLSAPQIFDRSVKVLHRERAAYLRNKDTESQLPLVQRVTTHLLGRLDDTTRKFKRVLLLGNHPQVSLKEICRYNVGIEQVVFVDPSAAARKFIQCSSLDGIDIRTVDGNDEELPLEPASIDLVVNNLGMHWVNDLQGSLLQCRLALKPDGLFLGTMLGGTSLQELRTCLALAEQERKGGVSPRLSPLVQVSDAGQLLTDSGFKLISVDVDNIVMKYRNAWDLIQNLRLFGESNAVNQRQEPLGLDAALAMNAIYEGGFCDEEGWINANFQVIYMTGWSPDPTQQKPARRGSADMSLEDLDAFSARGEIADK